MAVKSCCGGRLRVGIAVGTSLTRRVIIAWHERARESMGETPMPLSNTPSHNLLKQRAGKRETTSLVPHLRIAL